MYTILFSLFNVACDPQPMTVDQFRVRLVQAECDKLDSCDEFEWAGATDLASCNEALENDYASIYSEADCSNYDSDMAQGCLADLANASCDLMEGSDAAAQALEKDCSRVCSHEDMY